MKRLIAAKAEINAVHPEGVNALMYAAAGGHVAVASYLIEQGAEVYISIYPCIYVSYVCMYVCMFMLGDVKW